MSERDLPPVPDLPPSSDLLSGTDLPSRTRRAVLRAAGLAALAGGGVSVLAACSSDAGVAAPAASSSATPTAGASSASPSASAAPSTPAPSASAVPTGPSVATADVPVGGGVILDDAKFVVTQPTEGEFKAFSSICTHQGCPVTQISGKAIICNCHGSEFSIEDGSVLKPPASQPLAETATTVSGDSVFVEA